MTHFQWEVYVPEGDYLPAEVWGHDHFSTLAYVETCAVNDKGILNNNRMRCNARLHRPLANIAMGRILDGSMYPTRLRDKALQENHDDWSCLEDFVAAGFAIVELKQVSLQLFGNFKARVTLTEKGHKLGAAIREHSASGGRYGDFPLPEWAQTPVVIAEPAAEAVPPAQIDLVEEPKPVFINVGDLIASALV